HTSLTQQWKPGDLPVELVEILRPPCDEKVVGLCRHASLPAGIAERGAARALLRSSRTAWEAMIHSSLVGSTTTRTRLRESEIVEAFAWLAPSSMPTPS